MVTHFGIPFCKNKASNSNFAYLAGFEERPTEKICLRHNLAPSDQGSERLSFVHDPIRNDEGFNIEIESRKYIRYSMSAMAKVVGKDPNKIHTITIAHN